MPSTYTVYYHIPVRWYLYHKGKIRTGFGNSYSLVYFPMEHHTVATEAYCLFVYPKQWIQYRRGNNNQSNIGRQLVKHASYILDTRLAKQLYIVISARNEWESKRNHLMVADPIWAIKNLAGISATSQ